MIMERRIGEQFKYEGVTLEVAEMGNHNCEECFFFEEPHAFCNKMMCSMFERADYTDVYFKEVKK